MKKTLILAAALLVGVPAAGRAEWGWPPPGYSTTGVYFRDGHVYRGLCAKARDRIKGKRCGPVACDQGSPTVPAVPEIGPTPPTPPAAR